MINRKITRVAVPALLAGALFVPASATVALAATDHPERATVAQDMAAKRANANFPKGTQWCRNWALTSGNGRAILRVQEDGNFVLYKDGKPRWQAPGAWPRGNCAVFQEDGNFVLYDAGGRALWHSNTWRRGQTLAVQDDGNVVIYDVNNRPVWATNTGD